MRQEVTQMQIAQSILDRLEAAMAAAAKEAEENGESPKAPLSPSEHRDLQLRLIESANSGDGNLDDGIDCKACRNRGWFMVWDDESQSRVLRECECMVRRRNNRRLKASGMEDLVRRYTFDNWVEEEQWQKVAKQMAMDYAERREGWFLAAGNSGTGKTHLCTAICGKLIDEGCDTRYVLWRDFSTNAKAAVGDADEYRRLLEPLKRAKVLCIDDLFKARKGDRPTDADVKLAFELLNARYNDTAKLTLISTEWSLEGLLDIDEALGSRIYERAKKHWLNFNGRQNWRLRP